MPAYSGNPSYRFTRQFPRKVSVSFDNVYVDPAADFKVLVQCEPPKLYIDFKNMVFNNYQNFDLILTYDDRLLTLPNAKELCPEGSWVGDLQLEKRDQITYIMSSKIWTAEHRMRFMIMRRFGHLKSIGPFEFYMHRTPPRVESKESFFTNAKFHIACENQVMTNMYTEKILDCFRTRTVPIYYGCTNLDKYFNVNGVLQFDTIEKFEYIVNNLTPEYYDRMQPYVEENYQRARPYWEKSVYQRIEDEIQKYLF
jgi:hypothetical protein